MRRPCSLAGPHPKQTLWGAYRSCRLGPAWSTAMAASLRGRVAWAGYDARVSDFALLLLVILGVILLFRGPKVLPRFGAMLGRGVRDVRHAADEKFGGDEDDEPAAPQPQARP